MSVALVIAYTSPTEPGPTYVPVATEAAFATHWVPAARALGCVWIPEFQTGRDVEREHLAEVRREFEALRDHFATATLDPALAEYLRSRSRHVADVLAALERAALESLFIG